MIKNNAVLVVTDLYPPENVGGMAQYAKHFTEFMSSRHKVYVLVPNHSKATSTLDVSIIPCLTRIGVVDKIIISYYIILKKINLVHITTGGFSFLNFKKDLIYIQRLVGNDFIRPWLNRPLIIRRILYRLLSIAGFKSTYHILDLKYRRLSIKRELKKADSIILNSRFTDNLLVEHLGTFKQVQIRTGGYDKSVFNKHPVINDLESNLKFPDCRLLVTASNLVQDKRLDRVINIFRMLKEMKNSYKLLIAGIGPLENKLKQASEKANLENEIIFLGKQNQYELSTLYKSADCYISMSDFESMGRSVIEALASGLPVIATAVGGVPEILNPQHGLLFSSDESDEEIAGSIHNLFENECLENIKNALAKNDNAIDDWDTLFKRMFQNLDRKYV